MIKLCVISDDYDSDLLKEKYYHTIIEKGYDLKIFEDYPISYNLDYYDILVLDFGMVGNLTVMQLHNILKHKQLYLCSAMPSFYVKEDKYYKKYFEGIEVISFQFEYMTIEINRIRSCRIETGDEE